jgi:hypothetical protein
METNGDWKVKSATFQGYMKAKVDDMETDISEIKAELKCLNGFDKQMALKVGGLATGMSVIVSWILHTVL